MRPLQAYISLAALQHNLQLLRNRVPHAKVLAVIKSNAYGHDSLLVAKALAAADAFGVTCVDEAKQLRTNGITQPVVLMSGFFAIDELIDIQRWQLQPVVHNWQQLHALREWQQPIGIWLKFNTGMQRLGFSPKDASAIAEFMQSQPQIEVVSLMTHLATAATCLATTNQQLAVFKQLLAFFPPCTEFSFANSASLWRLPANQCGHWIRPGLALYGLSPLPGAAGFELGLQPVMHLCTKLIALQEVQANLRVGYGGRFTPSENTVIGIAAVGYGDGLARDTPDGTPTLVNGVLCPIAGRVAMDLIHIDLGAGTKAQVGDTVTLWGPDLPAERVAKAANLSVYELVTRLSSRVQRQAIKAISSKIATSQEAMV